MLTIARVFVLLLIAAMPNPALSAESNLLQSALKYEGKPIAEIRFDPPEQPLSLEELRRTLPFHVGDVFHEQELRLAIRNLFETGRFSDLAVDASESNAGLVLRFLTKRAYFVGRIQILGVPAPPNKGELTSATQLRLGLPYANSDASAATNSLQHLLQENGFYHAKITPEVEFRPTAEEVNVLFDVDTWKRARFEQPAYAGDADFSIESLTRATHWKRLYGLLGWQEVTEVRLRQGLDNLHRFYEKHNWLDTRIKVDRLVYHDETNTARPLLSIEPGIQVQLRVTGARISDKKLHELVPIFQEHTVDADLLREGERNIQEYLVGEGYFGATVTYSSSSALGGRQSITYRINRGERHKFVHLELSGNRYFLTETLRERLYLQPAQFPRFPYGRYSDAILRQDVQSIQRLYSSNGFRDAKLTSRIEDDYRRHKNQVAVFIGIAEGPQSFVASLDLTGIPPGDLAGIRPRLYCSPGQPYSDIAVAEDRQTILDYFYNRGFLDAAFQYFVDVDDAPNSVRIRYVVDPGNQKYVRTILITGLDTTRLEVVKHRMELHEEQPLSLVQQTDTQRRLYELGVFARVNTAIQNPEGDELGKTVLYDLDEARHYSLNVGFGAQIARIGGGETSLENPAGSTGFAPRVALGLTRINLFGLAQTISTQTALSTIGQRAAITYFVPQFISHNNLNLTFSALVANESDVRTYTAHRREASLQLGQRLSRAYTAQYRVVLRHVTLSNVKINQLLVPFLSQPETVGLAQVSLIQDKRDDPADAHRGVYSTAELSYAAAALGSQTQFVRALFRNSTYYHLRGELIFARSTQFGVVSRTGGRPSIPLPERLYSGGSTSIRAFPAFQAGPRDLSTGFPLGGNTLFTNNLELRFPIYGDNLAGVLFHDMGNVYDRLSDFSLRFRQANLQDFNYAVQSLGFGVRYRTPIGPIRLDLSFSPNAPRFFGLKGTEQDYLNGTAIPTVQKINAFQFHFSLGQAF